MTDYEAEIRAMYDEIYADEPKVGDWVIIKHSYHETIITGEVSGLKHCAPSRGFQPDADFEFIVWSAYKIKIAGIKKWLNEDWEVISVMSEFQNKKLPKRERGRE